MARYQAVAEGLNTHCAVCGSSLSFHQKWTGDICDDWRCRKTRLDRQMEAHRREAALALGERKPEDYPTLVVPQRPGTIENLPAARRGAHLEFLDKLVMNVTPCDEKPCIEPGGPVAGQPPVALAAAVCAVCGGACCQRGGDQAFIDAAAIERRLAVNPELEHADIVRAYAAHLPARSIADSCVYHTFNGCALPRYLRADTCNDYRCSGLKQVEGWALKDGVTRVYVVVRQDNIIQRSAFVQAGNIRHYPATDAPPGSALRK